MPDTVDARGLARLLKRADSVLLYTADGHPSAGAHGYQLDIIERVPIMAGRDRVGERRVHHVVTIGPLDPGGPRHRTEFSYGSLAAFRTLMATEIRAAKDGIPRLVSTPQVWGPSRDTRTMVGTVSHADGSWSRVAYTLEFYYSAMDLTIIGDAEALRDDEREWRVTESSDRHCKVTSYTYLMPDGAPSTGVIAATMQ